MSITYIWSSLFENYTSIKIFNKNTHEKNEGVCIVGLIAEYGLNL